MKHLLNKEWRLAASPLSYIFLIAALMTMLPGYPILVGAFFICFGIFHSFQNTRETNDTLYSALLPVSREDIVRAKFLFTAVLQMIGFAIASILTAVRMTLLSTALPYVNNAMMNATPLYLAFMLIIFCAFNLLFVGGFFKTAYKIGLPFLAFGIAALLLISLAETLHHLPGLAFLNAPAGEGLALQFGLLAAAAVLYILATILACHIAKIRFARLDL
ncbi:MAG: ABC-2 transporter permease [Clostridia bacterium]|nr:ABC-2 transporter permease [Clostridia bacterium]